MRDIALRKYNQPKRSNTPDIKVKMNSDSLYYNAGDILTIYDSYISLKTRSLVYRLQEVPGEYSKEDFKVIKEET